MAAVTPPSRATAASVAAVIIAALALLSTTHRASVAGLSAHGQLVTAQDAGISGDAGLVALATIAPSTPGTVLTMGDAGLPVWRAAASGGASLPDAAGVPDGAALLSVAGAQSWALPAARDSIGPTIATGDALHHWRLTGSGPWSDLGTGAATLTATGSTWLTDRPGVSIWRGGVVSDGSPATGDRLSASTTIPSGSSLTLAMTAGARTSISGAAPWGGNRWLMIAWNGNSVTRNLFCFFASDSGVLISSGIAGSTANTATITLDWTIPHRIVATHAQSTGAVVLYVDGVVRGTTTDTGSRAAIDRIDVGGTAGNAFMATGLAVMADAQVWTRALTAAEVTTDWEAARAAMGR